MGVIAFARGVMHVDGEPRLLVCGDYPYFRDDPTNWRRRLASAREMGVDVVTSYVPWRHHEVEAARFDFRGETRASRNVVRFLELAREEGLRVLLKPGPFVHGELPFGGLPDDVSPDDSELEPELDAFGKQACWPHWVISAREARALPAPLGEAFLARADAWLRAVAREVIVPFDEDGFIVAVQLMNEGIYSDTSAAQPTQLGYAASSLDAFRSDLRQEYGSIDAYNAAHGTRAQAWADVEPPRKVDRLEDARALLAYLDWSAFQNRFYVKVARAYRASLIAGGLRDDMPFVFNFNPNGETYRASPASNDGWYTRAYPTEDTPMVYGTTNWVGVVAGDATAFRQYVMTTTARRGPAMEQNWGFSREYSPPYNHADPCLFESLVALACGATGIAAYTIVGTRAWREDPNLVASWVPSKTNDRSDATSTDYPGAAPIDSEGRAWPKRDAFRLLAKFLASECAAVAKIGPRSPLAWGVYPPYAFAGQWLPRGDADDLEWRPPLKAVPRAAYHGLDAFVELALSRGIGFRQVDLKERDLDVRGVRALSVSSHEFMDVDTQSRLARFVETGGNLLLTGLVPERDERMRALRGPLAERVFPHPSCERVTLRDPTPINVPDEPPRLVAEFVVSVEAPPDATARVLCEDRVVGYERRVGAGRVSYLGASPWRARLSGDDAVVSRDGQAIVGSLLARMTGPLDVARPAQDAGGEVVVWEHGDARDRVVFVIVRDHSGSVEIVVPGIGEVRLEGASQVVHALRFERDRLASCYLNGLNDARGERVAPWVRAGNVGWRASGPCEFALVAGQATFGRVAAEGIEVETLGSPRGVEAEPARF